VQPAAAAQAQTKPDDVTATDEERSAVLITSFDFDVHLLPLQNALNMRCRITVKNDAARPLGKIPLQISSSLDWVEVRRAATEGSPEIFPLHVRTLDSDIDHTGKVHETVVVLRQPLAAGASISLELFYSGTVTLDATRLERIGTPHDAAVHTDWDRIDSDFISLTGFGSTLWHPAAAPPVLLGDGAKLFHAIGVWRDRESGASVHTRVTLEYQGELPNLTLLNGQHVALSMSPETEDNLIGLHVARGETQSSTLGFAAPSIFIADREESEGHGMRVFAELHRAKETEAWQIAAGAVTPLMTRWFGEERKRELVVVDLPEAADAPVTLDNILLYSLPAATPIALPPLLAHSLTHAYFVSPRVWLSQGVPQFMSSLWTEKNSGRDAALAELDQARVPLALAEPDKADADGEPLISAVDEVYYRTKSTFVLWMLRSLMEDDALAAALKKYRAADDKSPKYFEQLCESASHQDLEWFFNDWVYHDKGLPSLSIAAVNSRAVPPGSYLVEVEVRNSGNAVAPVPVTVRAGEATTTQRLRVPGQGSAVTRFVMPAKPDSVVVNDGTVPEAEVSRHEQKLQ
jgi:hypothetical protein